MLMSTIGMVRNCRLLPFGEGPSGLWEDARLLRKSGEFRHGLYLQFCSDRGAMQLHSPLVDAQIPCKLLIESSPHNVRKHFKLALGERVEART